MKLDAYKIISMIALKKRFNRACEEAEGPWDEDLEVETGILNSMYRDYFGNKGTWEDFYYHCFNVDDPTDAEFGFYLTMYLKSKGIIDNSGEILKDIIEVICTEGEEGRAWFNATIDSKDVEIELKMPKYSDLPRYKSCKGIDN